MTKVDSLAAVSHVVLVSSWVTAKRERQQETHGPCSRRCWRRRHCRPTVRQQIMRPTEPQVLQRLGHAVSRLVGVNAGHGCWCAPALMQRRGRQPCGNRSAPPAHCQRSLPSPAPSPVCASSPAGLVDPSSATPKPQARFSAPPSPLLPWTAAGTAGRPLPQAGAPAMPSGHRRLPLAARRRRFPSMPPAPCHGHAADLLPFQLPAGHHVRLASPAQPRGRPRPALPGRHARRRAAAHHGHGAALRPR